MRAYTLTILAQLAESGSPIVEKEIPSNGKSWRMQVCHLRYHEGRRAGVRPPRRYYRSEAKNGDDSISLFVGVRLYTNMDSTRAQ
ncbi:hypothetical protein NQ318_009366 [Aromia moschata]|uniref:Uncharacterized protein n=1 Tax=Aromia moschata TaxID=1265417 RepID=A0AAV8XF36_9CUCU|nr:hypothetical protein NQ318_009366 [Aromia moschata]